MEYRISVRPVDRSGPYLHLRHSRGKHHVWRIGLAKSECAVVEHLIGYDM